MQRGGKDRGDKPQRGERTGPCGVDGEVVSCTCADNSDPFATTQSPEDRKSRPMCDDGEMPTECTCDNGDVFTPRGKRDSSDSEEGRGDKPNRERVGPCGVDGE